LAVKFSPFVESGEIIENITLVKNTNSMVLLTEQHITTSLDTTVHYIKVVVGTNWKGKMSSAFQNEFGTQTIVILFVASPNATSIYGDTKLRS